MRTGSPTGPDLALLRELNARGVEYFLSGRVAAAVQGVPLAWAVLDIQTREGMHPTLYAAQLASGHEPQPWPPPPGREAYSPVRHDAYVWPGRFAAELARAVDVVLEGVPARAQPLAALLESLRESGIDRDAVPVVAAALAQRGEAVVQPSFAPETRLGTLYGARYEAVVSVLRAAGYSRASGERGGTYTIAFDDVDPRTGTCSADVSYREDPARPVAAEIQRALAAKG